MDSTSRWTNSTLKTSRRVRFFDKPYLWCENVWGKLTLIRDHSEDQFEVYRQLLRESGLPRPLPPGDYILPRHANGS